MSELKTGFKLPAEFHEAIGDYRSAIRSVKSEIKELEKEAKAAAKAGTELSADKKDRLATLQNRQIGLEATRDQAKAEAAAERDTMSGRILAAQQGAARAASVMSGRVGIGDMIQAGSGISRLGAHFMTTSAVGSAKFRAGAAIAKVGTKGAQFARFAAAPVALGVAVGYGAVSVAKSIIERSRVEAEGRSERAEAFLRTFTSDRFGSRFGQGNLEAFSEESLKAEQEVEQLNTNASMVERIYSWITNTPSVEASQRASAAGRQAEMLVQRTMVLGKEFEKATDLEKLKRDARVQKAVDRERKADYIRQGLNLPLTPLEWVFGDIDVYDVATGGKNRDEAVDRFARELQAKVMKTWEQRKKDEEATLAQDTDLQVSIRDRALHLRAIEIQDITERTAWSKY